MQRILEGKTFEGNILVIDQKEYFDRSFSYIHGFNYDLKGAFDSNPLASKKASEYISARRQSSLFIWSGGALVVIGNVYSMPVVLGVGLSLFCYSFYKENESESFLKGAIVLYNQ